jgi:hypothetical protein
MGKSRLRPSLIPPTCFITDFALPPIFRHWAAIPQLDKKGGFYIPAARKFHATPQLFWTLSGPDHSDTLTGIREFTGPFSQIFLMPQNGYLLFLIVTAMVLLFHEPQESQQTNHK